MKRIICALFAIFLISITFVMAQEARQQLIVLNNGIYTVTYFAEDLGNIIKVMQRQNPSRTETLLYLHSFEKNTRIGLLKSGNIKKKIIGSGQNRRNILEVKNQTHGGILELDHFTINGTFRISTEAIENGQVTRFELDKETVLTALTNDQDGELLIRCRANDRNCLRTVEFIEKENLLEQYINIRGEAELVRAKTEQQEETVLTSLQNIRGAIITEETIEAGTKLKVIGIPYLARRPGSLISWNKLKSDSTTLFEQTYAPNGIASSSKVTASSNLNVYDTCAKQNCGLTIFEALENSQVVFLNGNTPILQLIEGKIGVVETDNLYTECLIDPSNICVKINNNGRVLKIKANTNSKIKLEPLQGIRRINFDDLIGDNSEIVLENNGKRLIFNKEGAKYTGTGAWYSLRTSFKMPVILQGKRHVLECKAETQQCFVDGKLTLGPELKSCNSNEECGPQEKCSDNICVVKMLCVPYQQNQQTNGQGIDVLVASTEDTNDELKTKIRTKIFEGEGAMMQTAPFSSYRSKFNFWVMGTESRQENPEQSWHRACPMADYLLIIGTNVPKSITNIPRKIARVSTRTLTDDRRDLMSFLNRLPGGIDGSQRRIITHELGGHAIGRLDDEYFEFERGRTLSQQTPYANCAATREEAVAKFGEANSMNQGCGGTCDSTIPGQCQEWYTVARTVTVGSEISGGDAHRGTLSVMGDQLGFSNFNDFDRRYIESRLRGMG